MQEHNLQKEKIMTARERVERLYQELLTDSVPDAVTRLTAALADAERSGMERAANILDKYAALCDETTKSFRKTTLRVMADQLKASADDGQGQAGEVG